ncbi:hypothetical protein HK102_010788, partial [Quaeritorhiza haematococci]
DTITVALSKDEESLLEGVIKKLEGTGASSFSKPEIEVVEKIAFAWPATHRFPGLDLLRLLILRTTQPYATPTSASHFLSRLLEAANLKYPGSSTGGDGGEVPAKTVETNRMLCLRALCNLGGTDLGKGVVRKCRQELLKGVAESWRGSTNKNLRIAYVTFILNVVVTLKDHDDDALRIDLLQELVEFLRTETDADSEFRGLVAIGSLIHNSPSTKEAAKLMDVDSVVRKAKSTTGEREDKLRKVEEEVAGL